MTDETPTTSEPQWQQTGGPLLDVDHLRVLFPIKSGVIIDRKVGQVHAVDDVSFSSTRARRSGSSANRAAARRP